MIVDRILKKIREYRFNRIKFKGRKDGYIIGEKVSFTYPENMILGRNISIGDFCSIQTWPSYRNFKHKTIPELYIGDNVSMMRNCLISCMSKIHIGSGCLLGDNVFITDNYHGKMNKSDSNTIPIDRALYSKGPVMIGENVWIGRNTCIMPNVTIGSGSVIGANSVVTHDVPSKTVFAGCPAKEIKKMD